MGRYAARCSEPTRNPGLAPRAKDGVAASQLSPSGRKLVPRMNADVGTRSLLQLLILRLGLLVDGNVGIGIFPKGEKVLIRLARGQPAHSLTFLMRTTSLIQLPREMTRRFSGDTSKAKMICSESKLVSLLGVPPASGTDQMFPIPFSFLA